MMSQADLADYLHCSRVTVKRYRRRGVLPPPDAMIGRRPRWLRETIARWVRERQAGR